MPDSKPRPSGMRQPPLQHAYDVKEFPAGQDGVKVYAASGYKLYIEGMWHGDYQQVALEPSDVPALIEALTQALKHNTGAGDPLAL